MRDVHLRIVSGGRLAACSGTSGGEGFTVLDVPDEIALADVIVQMSRVVIRPLRSQAVPWSAVAGKAQGAIVNLSAKTVAQRVDEHDERLVQHGGRKLHGIRLSPEAAAVLARLEAKGESATAAINRLLLQ